MDSLFSRSTDVIFWCWTFGTTTSNPWASTHILVSSSLQATEVRPHSSVSDRSLLKQQIPHSCLCGWRPRGVCPPVLFSCFALIVSFQKWWSFGCLDAHTLISCSWALLLKLLGPLADDDGPLRHGKSMSAFIPPCFKSSYIIISLYLSSSLLFFF